MREALTSKKLFDHLSSGKLKKKIKNRKLQIIVYLFKLFTVIYLGHQNKIVLAKICIYMNKYFTRQQKPVCTPVCISQTRAKTKKIKIVYNSAKIKFLGQCLHNQIYTNTV